MGPTFAEINHANLIHNVNLIRKINPKLKIMAIVKANAYGHGDVEISHTLNNNNIDYFGVAFPEEGIKLRDAGITTPILVLGAQLSEYFKEHLQYNLDITLADPYQIPLLKNLCRKLNKKANVHIKIDTGMNCFGFSYKNFLDYADKIFDEQYFNIVGIYSHFSSADEDDLSFTMLQLKRFQKIQYLIKKKFPEIIFHFANSAAVMQIPQSHFDMVRPGIMLYGNPPGPDFKLSWNLKEVMRFISKISLIREIDKGESASYNRKYTANSNMKAALIAAGYADGYNRYLSNRGEVLIQGERYKVIGNVCMDRFLVDIKNNPDIKIGDEVVLHGRQLNEHIKIAEVARRIGTIPYDITCQVSKRVQRVHLY